MAKIKVLQLSATNKKKDGTPIANDRLKVGVKTLDKDGNEVWINGFLSRDQFTWKDGDLLDLEVYNDEQWGLQFKSPPETHTSALNNDLQEQINSLINRVGKLENMMNSPIESASNTSSTLDANREILAEELPI